MVSRNHHNKFALSILAVIFIIVCLLHTKGAMTDDANSLRANKLSSAKIIEHLEQRLDELGVSLDRLWCKTVNIGSTGGFCLSEQNIDVGGNSIWDVKESEVFVSSKDHHVLPFIVKEFFSSVCCSEELTEESFPTGILGKKQELCRALEKLFGHTSVADFGAGLGHYGRCFLRKKESIFNIKEKKQTKQMDDAYIKNMGNLLKEPQVIRSWKGYDGAINVGYLSKGFIKQQDLSITDLWLGSTWDWVLSLEIGEHVPALYEDVFMENLVRHGCKGIVLSWALENQGGHHHVNGRSNAYIKKKMADRGLVNDVKAEEHLRQNVDVSWFKNTLMVFRYKDGFRCKNDPE